MKVDKKLSKRIISVLAVYNINLTIFLVMYMTNIFVTSVAIFLNICLLRVYRHNGLLIRKYYTKIGRYRHEIQTGVLITSSHLFMLLPYSDIYPNFGLILLLTFMYWFILKIGKNKPKYMMLLGLTMTMLFIKSVLHDGVTLEGALVGGVLVYLHIYNAFRKSRQHFLTKLSNTVLHLNTILLVLTVFNRPLSLMLFVVTLSVVHLNPQTTYSGIGRYYR